MLNRPRFLRNTVAERRQSPAYTPDCRFLEVSVCPRIGSRSVRCSLDRVLSVYRDGWLGLPLRPPMLLCQLPKLQLLSDARRSVVYPDTARLKPCYPVPLALHECCLGAGNDVAFA